MKDNKKKENKRRYEAPAYQVGEMFEKRALLCAGSHPKAGHGPPYYCGQLLS